VFAFDKRVCVCVCAGATDEGGCVCVFELSKRVR